MIPCGTVLSRNGRLSANVRRVAGIARSMPGFKPGDPVVDEVPRFEQHGCAATDGPFGMPT